MRLMAAIAAVPALPKRGVPPTGGKWQPSGGLRNAPFFCQHLHRRTSTAKCGYEGRNAMYNLKPGIKQDARRRWSLPDRVFFGHGACHILAGVFLLRPPLPGFYAERIVPGDGFAGNHVFATDGELAFDYHGYSCRTRLLLHHTKAWSEGSKAGWNCALEKVDFDLLDQAELNKRKMLGPSQYLHDPIPRALKFIMDRSAARRSPTAIRLAT